MRAHDSGKTGSGKTGTAQTRSGGTASAARDRAPATRLTSPPPSRDPAAVGGMDPASVLALQRAAGNAVVSRMLPEPEPEREPVQRSTVHDVLRSGGMPFTGPLKEEMEARLGADFSDVRLHTNAAAKASAAEIGARAYTSGNHVVLGDGGADKHTLAHELTHVVQQRQGPVAGTVNADGLKISDPSDRFEREAEEQALRALSGPAPVQRAVTDPGEEPEPLQRSTVHEHLRKTAGETAVQRVIHQEPSYKAKIGGTTSLTNRGDIDVEERNGEKYVRVYQTVFAPATRGGFKDTQQRADGSINLMNQKESAWLNMGRPWRSMHYMRTYQDQKNRNAPGGNASQAAADSSMVRSFLIPLETYRLVTSNAVSEKQIGAAAEPAHMNQSTDKAKDTDQYEIRGGSLDDVTAAAVPHSLVTYVRDDLVEQLRGKAEYGDVRGIGSMLAKLSMPNLKDFPEYRPADQRADGLVLPLEKGKMPDDRQQQAQIDRLQGLLDRAFPKDGKPNRDCKDARKELKKLVGLDGAKDREVDWNALRDRVRRAMNYAGMPAVLAEIYNQAKNEEEDTSGASFKEKKFARKPSGN